MADGTTKAIEKIEAGQLVLACLHDKPDADPTPCRVMEVYHNPPARLLSVTLESSDPVAGDSIIRATERHPFYIPSRGWVEARDLSVGDVFKTIDGSRVEVRAVEHNGQQAPVFNFRVENNCTYFVSAPCLTSALLVHNQSSTQPEQPPSTQPSRGYSDVFSNPDAAQPDLMVARDVHLSQLLLGQDHSPPDVLQLPQEIQLLLKQAVADVNSQSQIDKHNLVEWGGDVATNTEGGYDVWGPNKGGPAGTPIDVAMPPLHMQGFNPSTIGYLHVHPDNTLFSSGDLYNFLGGGIGKKGVEFSVLGSANGKYTWVLVRTPQSPPGGSGQAIDLARQWSGELLQSIDPALTAEQNELVNIHAYEQRLLRIAQNGNFLLYHSLRSGDPLTLVKLEAVGQ
jgi:hypothetical protein